MAGLSGIKELRGGGSLKLPKQLSCAVALALWVTPALSTTPEQAWKAGIAEQNFSYAKKPHAMLKIQDSVYLGDGQSAVLTGRKGDPLSWRWNKGGAPLLRAAVKGGKLVVTAQGKALDAALAGKSIPVDTDVDVAGAPTQVGAGVEGWRLFVYNQKAKAAADFRGVSYYPFDAAFRVTARFVPDPKLPPLVFRTSRGTDKQFFRTGEARFTLKGQAVTLPFYSDDARHITEMSAFFHDDLTGQGAYGAGRYVDVDSFGAFPPRRVIIDFNQAYNPNCARSAHFTCPVAVDAIPLKVAAGERDPHIRH